MAFNVKIDLKNIYRISFKDVQQRLSAFDTILIDGGKLRLGIRISLNAHPLMPDVYNLSFGPINKDGTIEDKARITHRNVAKVFSTVLFEGLSFLRKKPDKLLGIDGSNTVRTYLYYRCIQSNYYYLNNIFSIRGVNYYIRMLRETEDGNCDLDTDDIITRAKDIIDNEVMQHEKLHNYFIFSLKSA